MLYIILFAAIVLGAAYYTWIKDWKEGINIDKK